VIAEAGERPRIAHAQQQLVQTQVAEKGHLRFVPQLFGERQRALGFLERFAQGGQSLDGAPDPGDDLAVRHGAGQRLVQQIHDLLQALRLLRLVEREQHHGAIDVLPDRRLNPPLADFGLDQADHALRREGARGALVGRQPVEQHDSVPGVHLVALLLGAQGQQRVVAAGAVQPVAQPIAHQGRAFVREGGRLLVDHFAHEDRRAVLEGQQVETIRRVARAEDRDVAQ